MYSCIIIFLLRQVFWPVLQIIKYYYRQNCGDEFFCAYKLGATEGKLNVDYKKEYSAVKGGLFPVSTRNLIKHITIYSIAFDGLWLMRIVLPFNM